MAIQVRYLILFMVMMAAMVDYLARLNINVTIVSMVKPLNKSVKSFQVCSVSRATHKYISYNDEESTASRYDWSLSQQSAILGSFFYTYTALQIPFGRVSHAYGGKWVVCLGLLGTSIINLATPILSSNYYMFLASRLVMGICQAGLFPGCFGILFHWFPKNERSFAFALLKVGSSIGSILASSLSGYLCDHGFAGGWPSVFYVSGALAMVVFIASAVFLSSKPGGHFLISDSELEMIELDFIGEPNRRPPVPWAAILTSLPFWAVSISFFAQAFAYYVCSTELPTYMSHILHTSATTNGFIHGSFNFLILISNIIGAPLSEYLIAKKFTSVTNVRKIMITIVLAGMAICILLLPSFNCDKWAVVAIFIVFSIFRGLETGSFMPVMAEMSLEFTTVVYAMSNTVAINAAYIAPSVAGFILEAGDDIIYQWNLLFYFTAAILIAGLISMNFVQAKRQSWDIVESNKVQVN
ncbi:putative inorganic phosphate cotransporter [Halotydeus destructor]|nr:putative inorganic phosphate cotransporter [Halotydeus destructor]